jgi:hypothetical protein
LAVETVDEEAADTSEAHDDADASESSDYRRIRVYSSSSSGVPNVVVVANEAVEVAALPVLPFPPQVSIVSIVSIDGFESAEPSVFRPSFACGFGAACHFMFADAPAGYGTISGTAGNTLGLNGAVSVVLPLLGPNSYILLPSESSLDSLPPPVFPYTLCAPRPSYPIIISFHIHISIPVLELSTILPSTPPCASDSCSSPP